ncbi:ribosomal-processing cysteine protease Prp [Lentilactobacillus kribbianus]|uniref:ribosomal-processing cysteine protease Prp n=1 Tax=Lentilactobacillus kribbianus TaxID=2729622 RepID=UPI001551C0D6|nr:ribosomal-processing cysteine protease Prp [Lentilactobacillus kribbianus]
MIKARITHNQNQIVEFIITGHADAGEYGQDIVCAAVSVLSISTVNGLQEVAKITPEVVSDDENGGYLQVKIPLITDNNKYLEVNAILQTFENGLLDVTTNYSNYIQTEIID